MSNVTYKYKRNYQKKSFGKSVFDGNPTLILHNYLPPKSYRDAVLNVIVTFRSGISFNKAIDQVASLYPDTVNRDKLAEHTLKSIANDY